MRRILHAFLICIVLVFALAGCSQGLQRQPAANPQRTVVGSWDAYETESKFQARAQGGVADGTIEFLDDGTVLGDGTIFEHLTTYRGAPGGKYVALDASRIKFSFPDGDKFMPITWLNDDTFWLDTSVLKIYLVRRS